MFDIIDHFIFSKCGRSVLKHEIQANIRQVVQVAILQLKPSNLVAVGIFVSHKSKLVLRWNHNWVIKSSRITVRNNRMLIEWDLNYIIKTIFNNENKLHLAPRFGLKLLPSQTRHLVNVGPDG